MSPQDLIFFLSSPPQRTVTYIQSLQAPIFLLLQPKPRKWFSNGLVLGVQLFPITTKVQAFRPQFKRNLIGFSPRPPRFSPVKRFAANDDESVVVGLDEAEKEGRAPSIMPERFQRLFKEAPDPPLRWPCGRHWVSSRLNRKQNATLVPGLFPYFSRRNAHLRLILLLPFMVEGSIVLVGVADLDAETAFLALPEVSHMPTMQYTLIL